MSNKKEKTIEQLIKEIYALDYTCCLKLEEISDYWWAGVSYNGKDYGTDDKGIEHDKIGPNTPQKALTLLLNHIKQFEPKCPKKN